MQLEGHLTDVEEPRLQGDMRPVNPAPFVTNHDDHALVRTGMMLVTPTLVPAPPRRR
ncbi:MAG: hypothetical protein ACK5ZR_04570 [Gemmatimonadaceae bacterium]